MRRHHRLEAWDVDVYVVDTHRDRARVITDAGGLVEEASEWTSAGQVQTLHQGDGSDGVPEFHAIICIDRRVLDHETTTPAEQIKLCAHEADHAAGLILDYCGQPYDGASEAHAYLVGWLTSWVWQNLVG